MLSKKPKDPQETKRNCTFRKREKNLKGRLLWTVKLCALYLASYKNKISSNRMQFSLP